jgi:hypothetical protein
MGSIEDLNWIDDEISSRLDSANKFRHYAPRLTKQNASDVLHDKVRRP